MVTIEYSELSELAKEAAQNDGRLARRPLSDISKEILAHQMLLSRITRLIEEYDAAIKVKTWKEFYFTLLIHKLVCTFESDCKVKFLPLIYVVPSLPVLIEEFPLFWGFLHVCMQSLVPLSLPPACETLALRRQMARNLLEGELRILKSASAWLKNYCAALTTITCNCKDIRY